MRNAKKAESRDLPDGWLWTTLGGVSFQVQYGWTTSATAQGNIQLLRTTDITSGAIEWSTVPYCLDEPTEPEKFFLRDGDIVISRAGSVGASILVKSPPKAVFASYLIRIRPLVENQFLAYFLKSPQFWEQVHEKAVGIALLNVNASKLQQMIFPLPTLPEQKRIVQKLEELFSELDTAETALRNALEKLKTYRRNVLKAAVQGDLSKAWREQNKPPESGAKLLERILIERRKKWKTEQKAKGRENAQYKEPAVPNTKGLPELPEGWVWTSVEQLSDGTANSITDGPFGSNLKSSHYTDAGPRVVRLQNIAPYTFIDAKSHISKERYQDLIKHAIFAGDIAIRALGETAPTACIIPKSLGRAIVKADCIRYKVNGKFVNAKYIMYALNSPPVQEKTTTLIHGVGRPRLNLGEIKSITLPLPTLEEQNEIARIIEETLEKILTTEKNTQEKLRQNELLRQSILEQAFTGQLVPQDPTDEPASILLERIQKEKKLALEEVKVNRTAKPKAKNTESKATPSLLDVLRDAGKPMTPEEVFRAAGYNHDSLEEFYAHLKEALNKNEIRQVENSSSVQDRMLEIAA